MEKALTIFNATQHAEISEYGICLLSTFRGGARDLWQHFTVLILKTSSIRTAIIMVVRESLSKINIVLQIYQLAKMSEK